MPITGNQELLVVRHKVGRPQVSLGKSMECDKFPSTASVILYYAAVLKEAMRMTKAGVYIRLFNVRRLHGPHWCHAAANSDDCGLVI